MARNSATGELLGFANFQFLMEGSDEALYVMELQIEDSVRRMGLGRRMMQVLYVLCGWGEWRNDSRRSLVGYASQILELAAHKYEMKWIMLTVFKANEAAMKFYKEKLKYIQACCS